MRKLRAPRVHVRRLIFLTVISVFMAALTSVVSFSNTAFAADAEWSGVTLSYDGNTYAATTAAPDRPGEPNEYQWISSLSSPATANVLYFADDIDPTDATTATFISYTFTAPGSNYSSPSSPVTVTVTRDLTATAASGTTDCGVGAIGWIVCPVSNWIADGVDWIYDTISNFFDVQTITQSGNGIYELWQLVRTIANVVFIIVFLIIIFSQITGAGYSNYSIKDMIPRLIIGAILVNVSFWICALAVDTSNVLGHSIQAVFDNVRQNYVTTVDIDWTAATGAVLGGLGIAGVTGFAAATAGSSISLSFILISVLIPAALSVLAAFIVLAARQAIIVVLTAISPLAFVAFVLPNTRNLFDKWRSLFTNMLIIFPAFALLFGASQIAGAAIIKTAENAADELQLVFVLIGLAVQVIPLALTPLLSRLSSGLLSQVSGMVNNRQKGLADRARNWAQDNADMHKARKLGNIANDVQRRREGLQVSPLRARGIGRLGYNMDQSKRTREAYKHQSEELLSAQHEERWNNRIANPREAGAVRSRLGMTTLDQRTATQHDMAHHVKKQAETRKADHEAHADQHWNEYLDGAAGAEYRQLRHNTHVTKGISKVYDDDMTNADELALKAFVNNTAAHRTRAVRASVTANQAKAHQDSIDATVQETWNLQQEGDVNLRAMRRETALTQKRAEVVEKSMAADDQRVYETLANSDPGYAQVRQRRVQTVVDSKMGEFQGSQIETEGARAYAALFEDGQAGSRALRQQNVQMEQMKKETATIEATLQKRADAHWERVSQSDANVQTLRVRQTDAEESARRSAAEWNSLVERVRDQGAAADGFVGTTQDGNSLQANFNAATGAEQNLENLKSVTQSHAKQRFAETEAGRRSALRAQAAKDSLESVQADEAARAQELRTNRDIENLTGEDLAIATEMRNADIVKRAQDRRKANALGQTDAEYASEVASDTGYIPGTTERIATIAGGIDNYGEARAIASATQVEVDQFNKNVATEKSTMTGMPDRSDDPNRETWMSIVQDDSQSDERRAAAAGKIMQGGAMGTIQALYNYAISDPNLSERSRKNIEMQMGGDIGRVPFGMGAGARAAMASGAMDADTAFAGFNAEQRAAIVIAMQNPDAVSQQNIGQLTHYDAMLGNRLKEKISAEALVGLDPDDRTRITELFSDIQHDGGLVLPAEARANIIDAIRGAASNENLRKTVPPDAKRSYNTILAALGETPLTREDWA